MTPVPQAHDAHVPVAALTAPPGHAPHPAPQGPFGCAEERPPRPPSGPEAGFSLVEVLAALVIAAMMLIAAYQAFGALAGANGRVLRAAAARDLARWVLATRQMGHGQDGALVWQAETSPLAAGRVQRQVRVIGPNGPLLTLTRQEVAP